MTKPTRVKLNDATEAITELVGNEFGEEQLRVLRDVFKEVSYGKITITVAEKEIQNIQVTKNYLPIVDK